MQVEAAADTKLSAPTLYIFLPLSLYPTVLAFATAINRPYFLLLLLYRQVHVSIQAHTLFEFPKLARDRITKIEVERDREC